MNSPQGPELSVVLYTPDTFETIRRTIEYLQRQTVRETLEILIAAPSVDELRLDEAALEPFHQWRVVEVDPGLHLVEAKITAVRQASAPFVAFVEDHSYPETGWAAALIQAHQEGWAAVGPVVINANPDGMTSWAEYFLSFGPWSDPSRGGPVAGLPWHNTSYRRDLLLSYGDSLSEMLVVECLLQSDLRARGYSLYFSSAARIRHVNITRFSSYWASQFHGARVFAAARARYGAWPAGRRLLYIVGAPLIPLIPLRRVLRDIWRCGRQAELLPGIFPMLAVGLAAGGLGELLGYTWGAGTAGRKKLALETHRERHVAAPRPKVKGPA